MKDDFNNNVSKNVSLCEYLKGIDTIPFHMPGHKRHERDYLYGAEIDFTETSDTDNLHDAKGILKECMDFAAGVFGVKETRFLVNGSTVGILAGLRTLTRRGDTVLVARNCHKSVINAVEILGLDVEYVLPTRFEEYGFYGSVLPEDVERRLEETGAKVVVITSPTYEGIISDVKKIACICHSHGAALFVDEAHGAHLGLTEAFPKSARQLGADLVVNSLHKTLASLTQTALLHVCSDRVDVRRLDESLAMFETSSPSYVLMASIDGCVRDIARDKKSLDDMAWFVNLMREYFLLAQTKLFDKSLLTGDDLNKVFDYDKSKIVFTVDGIKFADIMKKEFNIEIEMASKNYAILMAGAGNTWDDLVTIKNAISQLSGTGFFDFKHHHIDNAILAHLPKKKVNPCETDGLSVEYASLNDAVGRVSAENIWAYPPGAPIVVKGEIIDRVTASYLEDLCAAGVNVSSSLKGFPTDVAVVKNEMR